MTWRTPLLLLSALGCAPADAQTTITGARVACVDSMAAGHSCHRVDLLSRLMPDRLEADRVLDMWGWTDSISGREYALVATEEAVAFVDVSDPINPAYLGRLPSHDSTRSDWRDLKVYHDYMFVVVDGAGANGLQVFDLTLLRSPPSVPHVFSASARYDGFDQAHNVAVNTATGYAYVVGSNSGACTQGLHMVDIRTPTQPAYAGCFRDHATGNSGDGYTHDVQCVVYSGPDADHTGKELCIGANINGISIADVTDKAQPQKITSVEYPDAAYAHQAWLTEDQRYLFLNDETDELTRHWLSLPPLPGTRTLIWDLLDVDDPVLMHEYFGSTGASDHNLYILGDTLYMANYASGLRIVDIADPAAPVEIAHFDTYPFSDHAGLHGAWTAYPFFGSGTIAITSGHHGLFLAALVADDRTAAETPSAVPSDLTLLPAYPNPFNQATTLTLHNPVQQQVLVEVRDLLGRLAVVLHRGPLPAGTHVLRFEARTLQSGPYIVAASAGARKKVRMTMLLK